MLAFLALVCCVTNALVAFEKPPVPNGWSLQGRADPNTTLSLYFFVPFVRDVESELLKRSTPGSPLFQQWLTRDEVFARFSDHAGLASVRRWLADLSPTVEGSNVVKVRTSVASAERLLQTRMGRFRQGVHSVVRATAPYHLPEDMARIVSHVGGVREFPALRRRVMKKPQRRSGAGLAITPRVIHDRYGTGNTHNTAANNSQAVAQ